MMQRALFAKILATVLTLTAGVAAAQRAPTPADARAAAPIDLTGYWVSVVSEDWRHRMATPRKGDYESMPLNAEARRTAAAWDLNADNEAGLQCKAYGVGGLMRQPTRLHITWQDANTLKVDFDAGTQTRLLRFDATALPEGEPSWQGFSRATWLRPPGANQNAVRAQIGNSSGPIAPGGGGRGQRGGPAQSAALAEGGSLTVSTTNFRPGYLRKNGVPYSENAKITEYFHRLPQAANGDDWLLVVTLVEDPRYLNDTFYVSTHFKRERNGDKWSPTPCHTAPPPGGAQSDAVPLPPL